jgi:hypothetical protein
VCAGEVAHQGGRALRRTSQVREDFYRGGFRAGRAVANSCCAFSRALSPLRIRLTFSASIERAVWLAVAGGVPGRWAAGPAPVRPAHLALLGRWHRWAHHQLVCREVAARSGADRSGRDRRSSDRMTTCARRLDTPSLAAQGGSLTELDRLIYRH